MDHLQYSSMKIAVIPFAYIYSVLVAQTFSIPEKKGSMFTVLCARFSCSKKKQRNMSLYADRLILIKSWGLLYIGHLNMF